MRPALMFATWIVAFLVGFGTITWPWLALCFAFGYMRAVLFMGDRIPTGDFRDQSADDFQVTQRVVWMSTLMTIIPIGIWFGVGKLAALLFR